MVVSRVRGSNLTLTERRSLSRRPWDLENDDVQADPTTLSGKADTAG
jgi:hypothetical protein